MPYRKVILSLLLSIVVLSGCRPDEGTLPSADETPTNASPTPTSVPSSNDLQAPLPTSSETPTAELAGGVWIGPSLYGPESPLRFKVEFEPDEWSFSVDGIVGVLTHQSLEGCEIRSTAGRGLGPDWTALNDSRRIGEIEFEQIEARHFGQLEFVSYYAGNDSGFYTGFQVGVEDVSLECLERAYKVLSTFQVMTP
ncbi:MAG TPA: hypothetical protein G4O08_00445 [Anaerolineae bacterium]|nr:hypothetical protein [Anaerolineae bacterium]